MHIDRAPGKVLVLTIGAAIFGVSAVYGDAINPNIKETDIRYSKEKANAAYYGTGVAGRLSEASELRFKGEQETSDGEYDSAITKLAKAIQLDPGEPNGHLLYARALTHKIRSGKVDPEEVEIALREWKLLWHHDSDQNEQQEAKIETFRMFKIARATRKKVKQEQQIAQKKRPLLTESTVVHF